MLEFESSYDDAETSKNISSTEAIRQFFPGKPQNPTREFIVSGKIPDGRTSASRMD
jgi:hypothetical protein